MLSNTFQIILEKIHSKTQIDKFILMQILGYVQQKSIDSIIYPELLIEKYDVDINSCLKILVLLDNYSILKRIYKIYCPCCQDFSYGLYENLNELEEYEFCDNCGKQLIEEKNPYKYVVVYFKVIKNE